MANCGQGPFSLSAVYRRFIICYRKSDCLPGANRHFYLADDPIEAFLAQIRNNANVNFICLFVGQPVSLPFGGASNTYL